MNLIDEMAAYCRLRRDEWSSVDKNSTKEVESVKHSIKPPLGIINLEIYRFTEPK